MKKYIIISSFFVLALALPVGGAFASFQNEGFYIMTEDEVIDDNVYVFAKSVDIQGTINGDLIVAAGSVYIKGEINGDVIVVGEDVTLEGTVNGDIRFLSGSTIIASTISGNVLGAGGDVEITDEASIGHSLTVAAAVLKMKGSIAKDILAAGESININGFVGEDVVIYTDREGGVVLGRNSRIGGNVQYTSVKDIIRLQGAEVAGIIQKIETLNYEKNEDIGFAGYAVYKLFMLIMISVVGILFIFLFPKISIEFAAVIKKQPGMSLLYGFALFFLAPIVFILLLITVIGIPLAFIVLALYFITIFLSKIVIALALGMLLLQKIKDKKEVKALYAFFTGILLITIFTSVPIAGQLLALILTWWGIGLLFIVTHRVYSGQKK